MIKIAEITSCDKCPNFDDFYYSYNEKCKLLNRVILKAGDTVLSTYHPIPEDCPLEDKK